MMHRLGIVLALVCSFLSPPVLAEESKSRGKEPRQMDFSGYSKQHKKFRDLCARITADGHPGLIYSILSPELTDPRKCPECYQLLRSLAAPCKPKKARINVKKRVKKSKVAQAEGEGGSETEETGGEDKGPGEKDPGQGTETTGTDEEATPTPTPSPTPNPPSPTPSAATRHSAQLLFRELADIPALRGPSAIGVNKLFELFTKAEGKTENELAYLSALATIVKEPYVIYQELDRFEKKFAKVCYYLETDRRQSLVLEAINTEKADENCATYKPLLWGITHSCTAEEAESPAPSDEVTDPSEAVATSAVELFSDLAVNATLADILPCAVRSLSSKLMSSGKAISEKSYLQSLAESIRYPFRYYLAFASYHEYFAHVCNRMSQDGRARPLHDLMAREMTFDKKQPALRPLMVSFVQACTAAPEDARIPQRLPNLAAINAICDLSLRLRLDQELKKDNKAVDDAVHGLANILHKKNGMSRGEADYFDVLAEYWSAPFTQPKVKKGSTAEAYQQAPKSIEEAEQQGQNVEELFDF